MPVWHLFTRGEGGIESAVHYPRPAAFLSRLRTGTVGSVEVPVTDFVAGSILSMQLQPYLRLANIDRMCDRIAEWNG